MNLGAVFRSQPLGDGKTVMPSTQAHQIIPREPWVPGDSNSNTRLLRTPSQHTGPRFTSSKYKENKQEGT